MSFSIDAALRDPGYPGLEAAARPGRFRYYSAIAPLRPHELERFWLLEYRWPNGVTPLGLVFFEDGSQWAIQQAAYRCRVPGSNGLDYRSVGTHMYSAELTQASAWEADFRAFRIERELPKFLERFAGDWQDAAAELLYGLRYFETFETAGRTLQELGQFLEDARTFQRRAWELHFEFMYPLLLNHAGLCDLCRALGLPGQLVGRFFQGFRSRVMDGDMALWSLIAEARQLGVASIIAHCEPGAGRAQLAGSAAGRSFLEKFDRFLEEWGWRTETVADPAARPWIEDSTVPLELLRSFIDKGSDYDFEATLAATQAQRNAALTEARQRLTSQERAAFDAAWNTYLRANFVQWNEDHNPLIDMRATIPLRRAALALGRALDLADPEDCIFAFFDELTALAQRRLRWQDLAAVVEERRAYYRHWLDLRSQMPKYVGTPPATINDPIMIELDGVNEEFLAAVRGAGTNARSFGGMPASAGRGRGRARVLHSADELHRLRAGDVLVCEGTSPSWTPAFTKIAACVCDQGGTLAHAAIVSREYRVPCVVATGIATRTLRNGDLVEVDGTAGTVTILEPAAQAS